MREYYSEVKTMNYVTETLIIGKLLGIKGTDDYILAKIEGLKYN